MYDIEFNDLCRAAKFAIDNMFKHGILSSEIVLSEFGFFGGSRSSNSTKAIIASLDSILDSDEVGLEGASWRKSPEKGRFMPTSKNWRIRARNRLSSKSDSESLSSKNSVGLKGKKKEDNNDSENHEREIEELADYLISRLDFSGDERGRMFPIESISSEGMGLLHDILIYPKYRDEFKTQFTRFLKIKYPRLTERHLEVLFNEFVAEATTPEGAGVRRNKRIA